MASAPSIPDFLEMRFDSPSLRYLSFGVLSVVTLLFLAAQLTATGLIAAHIFKIPSAVGIAVGAIAILGLAISAQRGMNGSAHIVLAVAAVASIVLAAFWLLSAKTFCRRGVVGRHRSR